MMVIICGSGGVYCVCVYVRVCAHMCTNTQYVCVASRGILMGIESLLPP